MYCVGDVSVLFFFFKQKTAYEMRISDWSSDVCSSDLLDMLSPGVSVRPIVMSSGEHIQNQVFFDQVRIPKRNVLGAIGDGWTVAKFQQIGSASCRERVCQYV